jgi:cytosine/adenosine deaminase-related metal-dependent hydrolase
MLEGENQLLLPGFVDGHIHIDKTLWGLPWRPNQAGPRLIDKIENERRLRRELRLSVAEQSERLVREAIARGSSWLRTHVDIDTDNSLTNFEGVLATREKLAGAIDIQLVAFPQSGLLTRPGTLELITEAVAGGAEVVGGLDPAGIDRNPTGQLDAIFNVAERYGAMIDIHLHDRGELGAFQIELIAERTSALGLQGRVAVSHAFCLAMIDDDYLTRLTELLLENDIAIMTHGPGNSPFPPILRLTGAGVRLFSGSDGVRDAWGPFGNADMLERAWILSYRSNFRKDHEIERALHLTTLGGAAVLGVRKYGLEVGCRADLVVVPGDTPAEAVINRPVRSFVIKGGILVAQGGHCLV